MGRIGIALGAAAVWLVLIYQPTGAEACGVWHLEDIEREQKATFYVHRVFVSAEGEGRRRIMRIAKGKTGPRAARGRRPLFTVEDGELRRRGRTLGKVDGDRLTLGGDSYQIALEKLPKRPPNDWRVRVTRDGELVARGEAMVLCGSAHDGMDRAVAEQNIRRRVIYYLAWRQSMTD